MEIPKHSDFFHLEEIFWPNSRTCLKLKFGRDVNACYPSTAPCDTPHDKLDLVQPRDVVLIPTACFKFVMYNIVRLLSEAI